jgi:hypothetical protein
MTQFHSLLPFSELIHRGVYVFMFYIILTVGQLRHVRIQKESNFM